MWIRSQDRVTLVNINGFYLDNQQPCKIYGFINDTDRNTEPWLLGKYETKERAIKILEDLFYNISLGRGAFSFPEC